VHGRPSAFLHAVRSGTSTASGIILQFPFYGGIFGVLNNTELSAWIGSWFVRLGSTETYALLVYLYSALMNLFVPSAGSKWLIEAPFLIPAGEQLGVSISTIILAYAYGDSTTNLIQPFWALPLLAVTRLRFGDILGYTLLVALACLLVNVGVMLLIPATL
jgi:short-chain fatty acids transporter